MSQNSSLNSDAGNPLLDFSGLPRFSNIKTEHVEPAIDHLLACAKNSWKVQQAQHLRKQHGMKH